MIEVQGEPSGLPTVLSPRIFPLSQRTCPAEWVTALPMYTSLAPPCLGRCEEWSLLPASENPSATEPASPGSKHFPPTSVWGWREFCIISFLGLRAKNPENSQDFSYYCFLAETAPQALAKKVCRACFDAEKRFVSD